ncbi:centromere protein I-like [Ostrinia nubilalis]|uniref:centromere protein I-like n=1 Tax=Ostrinia nubilalis TaxID=29057 RepID=UPI0030824AFE
MADVEDIIDYIKSLKKGFDKDLFQSKIDELAYAVETTGLHYDDFHTLFKLWLNLSIPITKWTSLGACLVPPDTVEEKTVDYSFRWILANCENQSSFSRIGFLLDWLTVAMDCECIDMRALDSGYEIFYIMLTYEVLTVHAIKLVYTLTKPIDVTRRRVLELLDYAKKREGKKNMYRQLQVLLGLFKSYKPECVPEDVPAISIHTAFKKVNVALISRFRRVQERRNILSKERHHLMWINPLNSDRGRNKKVEPLVPNMEFINVGAQQYSDKEPQKTYLDFSDPVSLLQYSLHHPMSRPARLRALLCNETGLTLLAVASDADHAFLTHDLHHLLTNSLLCNETGLTLLAVASDADHAFLTHNLHHLLTNCFLDVSPHSAVEKRDLLRRLVLLQNTLLQAVPIVTRFLAQYLPLWNEIDFYAEILDLVQWVSVDSPDQVRGIVEPLTRVYHRSQPLEQCAILRSLTNMYTNMLYGSTKRRQHFKSPQPYYTYALSYVASSISRLSSLAVQTDPGEQHPISLPRPCLFTD